MQDKMVKAINKITPIVFLIKGEEGASFPRAKKAAAVICMDNGTRHKDCLIICLLELLELLKSSSAIPMIVGNKARPPVVDVLPELNGVINDVNNGANLIEASNF